MNFRSVRWLRQLLLVLCVGMVAQVSIPEKAEARAGSGRSFGRGGGGSFRRPPSYQRQRETPPPQNNGMNNMPQNQPGRGNFFRGLAGGLAGGLLGSMLFSSLGFGAGGVGGGGIGFLEIILLGGLIYFGLRWWKSRQLATQNSGSGALYRSAQPNMVTPVAHSYGAHTSISAIASDEASDIFFRIQGAWTRRDLTPVRGLLGKEVAETLDEDISALRRAGKINRLENISVRDVSVGEAWGDDGLDYATVRFAANLLDYTVDEKTNAVLAGSDSTPVKFEEDWTFARGLGSKWQLVGIDQVH